MLGNDGTRIKIYSAGMVVVESDGKKDRTVVFEIRIRIRRQ